MQNSTINKIFKAIADPTRRDIFHALIIASTAMPITEVSAQFEISRQGVTKHLKTLEEAGLIEITSQGRERFCNANPKPLQAVQKWLMFYEQFWTIKIDSLENFLDNKKEEK